MAPRRIIGFHAAASCLLLTIPLFSACGVQLQAMVQPPTISTGALPAPDKESSSSHIFAPCAPGMSPSLVNAYSAAAELLVGKDRYATQCAPDPATKIPLTGVVERAGGILTPDPNVTAPAPPADTGALIPDELVSAVLIGTGEYWYQPVIGPA